jgi:Cof subfamily protein (haloacid dehalogenase superfamily)
VTVRAVALDLDGTLFGARDVVSDRNRAAVQAVRARGWHVVLATARWYQLAERTAMHLGLDDPVIACSGAEVRRLRDGADLFDVRLPEGFSAALYGLIDSAEGAAAGGMTMVYQHRDVLLRGAARPASPSVPELRWVPDLSAADRLPRAVVIFSAGLQALAREALFGTWQHDVRFLASVMSSGAEALTLTGSGADKGVALGVACADLGIELSEVVAIGDSETDIEMFRVAGAGVAMGQAPEVVRDEATWVTASNVDDGVAVALERLLDEARPTTRDDVHAPHNR